MQNAEQKQCLVTGVAGFVGSHLAERLLALHHKVVGVDNFSSGHWKNMQHFADHPDFAFDERSITEPGLINDLRAHHPALSRCFHLAAIVSVPYSMDHPEETMAVNQKATVALLEGAERLGFHSFVFAGSAAEYGDDQRLPLVEAYATESTKHLSPYGRAKFLASRAVSSSPIGVALRFFNIYGPRQDPASPYSGVISRFAEMGLTGMPLSIFGDGLQTRDFIHVSDVVEAYLRAAGLSGPMGRVPVGIYNIGTGKSTTVLDLAEIIRRLSRNDQPLAFLPPRSGDIRHSVAAVGAFQETAGFRPAVSLEDGLRETLRWVASTLG